MKETGRIKKIILWTITRLERALLFAEFDMNQFLCALDLCL